MSLFDDALNAQHDDFPEHDAQLTGHRRREARFAAAQLLYAHLLTQLPLADLVNQELKHGAKNRKFDKKYLTLLTNALAENLPRYETMLARWQKEAWPLERWELMHKSLLLTALAELEHAPADVAAPIVVSEYLTLADGFATPEQSGFLNAVLDKAAKELRPQA